MRKQHKQHPNMHPTCLCRIRGKLRCVFDIQSVSQMGRADQNSIFADIITGVTRCVHLGCRNIWKRLFVLCFSSVGAQG